MDAVLVYKIVTQLRLFSRRKSVWEICLDVVASNTHHFKHFNGLVTSQYVDKIMDTKTWALDL